MNYNLLLLRNLYLTTSGKYQKFRVRFDKAIQSGRFQKLSKRKQSSLITRLKKLYERLKSLQTQLRIAGAGAALALTLSVSNPIQAQNGLGPFVRNDALNPLPPPVFIRSPRPAVVDIDNDGDLDVFVGNQYGYIQFFRNDAPQGEVTRLTELTGADNPLDGVDEGSDAAPAFADIDGDGDFDLLFGTADGETFFFRNTGTKTNPVFTQQTGSNNPFDGITGTDSDMYGLSEAVPTFVDFDGDSDIDLFIGSSYVYDIESGGHPAVEYYENNAGVFTQTSATGLGGALEFESGVTITFADVTNDGGLDALIGSSGSGYVRCFVQGIEQQFTEQNGVWDPNAKTGNPFYGSWISYHSAPVAADFDRDGDLDFLVGVQTNYYSDEVSIRYFENIDGKFSLEYKSQLNISPFGGVDVGREATPVFVDLDNDGDMDAVLGEKYSGTLHVFINEDGRFYEDTNHPLTEILYPLYNTYDVTPVFADIDNDGDQDLFASMDNQIAFFRNENGTFVNETSPIDPSLYNMSLALIDVDKDGDLDALIGHNGYEIGEIDYFQNNGTASSPNFVAAAAPDPFNVTSFEKNPTLYAIDIDHDGDTDLIVTDTYNTESYGYYYYYFSHTLYYENKGDGTFTENEEPLLIENTADSFTSYADIDGDGDLDAFLGNGDSQEDGKVFYFENTNPAPVTTVTQSSVTISIGVAVRLDPNAQILDEDEDDIVLATVTISNFSEGNEVLDFTPSSGVTGEFGNGVLIISGKASIDEYETILRSVTYEATGSVTSARQASGRAGVPPAKTVTFSVRDTDFTETIISIVSVITLNLTGELAGITVYNAVSPGVTTGLNDYMRIDGLSSDNTVTVFNRWGDEVFKVSGYDNNSKRFEGKNDNGKELPSGTYFYTIEVSGKTHSGYLSLKR